MRFDVIHNLKFLISDCKLPAFSGNKAATNHNISTSVSQLVLGFFLKAVFGLHQTHLPSLMPNLITQFRRHYASRPGICQYVDWETTVDIKAFFLFLFSPLLRPGNFYFSLQTNTWHQPLQELPAGSMIEMKFILEIAFGIKWFVVKLHFFFRMAAFAFSENRVIYVLLICQTSWSTLVVCAVTFNSVYLLLFFIGDHSLMLCMPFSIIYKNTKYDWGFWVALSVYFDFLLSGFLCLWERKTLIWSSQPG